MASHLESRSQEEQIKLKPPQRYMSDYWGSSYLMEACEKSSTALNGMNKSRHQLSALIDAAKVENLFLIGSKRTVEEYVYRGRNNLLSSSIHVHVCVESHSC